MSATLLRELHGEPIVACNWGATWVHLPGHVSRRKFIGHVLSRRGFDFDLDPSLVVRLDVHQGYAHHVEQGGDEWCEAGWVTYFRDSEEPEPGQPAPAVVEPCTWADVSEAMW